ncbi:MAG: NAD(P)H-hydrate dehydratase [Xanthomonadales bacterium]|nr:NAD(P)H-hydrate dehydratase [Xanthomonadales bacterium]
MDWTQDSPHEVRLYTAAEVRQLDRCAIEAQGIAGEILMERAGQATFECIRSRFPDIRHWCVICGGGNNGGDGYVIARLATEAGIDCVLYALRAPHGLSGDAALAAQRWSDAGGVAVDALDAIGGPDTLFVDALLGTGVNRPAEGQYAAAIAAMNQPGSVAVSVDIPSGLNADTGQAMGGVAVNARATVTFIGQKRGLYTADGPDHAGIVEFSRLEVPDSVYETVQHSGILIQENIIAQFLRPRPRNSHKGDFGWLLGVGGDQGMCGALLLCGTAALRSGAGKVTLLTHPGHANTLNANRPELMVRGIGDGGGIEAFSEACDVMVLGTGLGQSAWSRSVLEASLMVQKPMVIDADGLNLMAKDGVLESFSQDETVAVLTPHPAEAARLLKDSAAAVQADRVGAAQELARRSGAVVVLKGCGTVVSGPDGRYAICTLGNPGMASGGTGDVLAGVIGAMLAQGLGAWAAAMVGVVAHAAAGDRAARQVGERGMVAGDIVERLPAVLNPR